MGAKIKTQKIPWTSNKTPKKSLDQNLTPPQKSHVEFLSHTNFQKALNDMTPKIEKLVSNTPQKLNQAPQKITCQNFCTQKIPKLKISNPQKSCDHPCH